MNSGLFFGLIALALISVAISQLLWAVVFGIAAIFVLFYETLRVSNKYAKKGYANLKTGAYKEWNEVEGAKGNWPKGKFDKYLGEAGKRVGEEAYSPPSETFQLKKNWLGAWSDGAKNFWKEFWEIFKK
ncbi:MAG: hypothetical protein V1847_02560 [Candidatus Diapherotrites archaeon]